MDDRQFISGLYQRYYAGKEKIEKPLLNANGKARCVVCGYLRLVGVNGHAKGKCKKCRKAVSQDAGL